MNAGDLILMIKQFSHIDFNQMKFVAEAQTQL